ncbi:hypothetical protein Hanom_Chr00s080401g01793511 [Helianthus anomalus]
MLSHQTVGEQLKTTCNSRNIDITHLNSAAVCARARYSASVLDRATTCCFLELQLIKLEPRNTQ